MFHSTLFQWIVVPILCIFCMQSLRVMARGAHWRAAGFRAILWFTAATAVLYPQITMSTAKLLGIGRGTDLVLYLFIIGSLSAGLYFYGRIVRLETATTVLVRQLALKDSQDPNGRPLEEVSTVQK